jgi:hypothetical protein
MPRFRYLLDPLCLAGCAIYAVNRWMVKPNTVVEFFHFHFNDVWLIPCALPLLLWLHRKLDLRAHDRFPSITEVLLHLGIWCVTCEGIGPRWVPGISGDFGDVLAYSSGAIFALGWWRWQERRALAVRSAPLNA